MHVLSCPVTLARTHHPPLIVSTKLTTSTVSKVRGIVTPLNCRLQVHWRDTCKDAKPIRYLSYRASPSSLTTTVHTRKRPLRAPAHPPAAGRLSTHNASGSCLRPEHLALRTSVKHRDSRERGCFLYRPFQEGVGPPAICPAGHARCRSRVLVLAVHPATPPPAAPPIRPTPLTPATTPASGVVAAGGFRVGVQRRSDRLCQALGDIH